MQAAIAGESIENRQKENWTLRDWYLITYCVWNSRKININHTDMYSLLSSFEYRHIMLVKPGRLVVGDQHLIKLWCFLTVKYKKCALNHSMTYLPRKYLDRWNEVLFSKTAFCLKCNFSKRLSLKFWSAKRRNTIRTRFTVESRATNDKFKQKGFRRISAVKNFGEEKKQPKGRFNLSRHWRRQRRKQQYTDEYYLLRKQQDKWIDWHDIIKFVERSTRLGRTFDQKSSGFPGIFQYWLNIVYKNSW